jgi:nitrogen fixation protein NifU and related proteins
MSNNIQSADVKHSKAFLEMSSDDSYHERMYQPNGYGKNTGDCGDTVEIFLTVKNGLIKDATFDTDGCVNTFACANTVIQTVWGKPLDVAWEVSPELVIDYLKTLPEENFHCAELAVGALYLAVSDYEKHKP